MNILKIKLITFVIISIFYSNYSIAQVTHDPTQLSGLNLNSKAHHDCNLKFKGVSNAYLGGIYAKHRTWGDFIEILDESENFVFSAKSDHYTKIGVGGQTYFSVYKDGQVSIAAPGDGSNLIMKAFGTNGNTEIDTDQYRLFVQNGILTEKCKVAVKSTGYWSDYVFEEDYEMMEIEELEDYVTENKHLPNVPSAEEVVKNGLDVATMDAKLLEKIEEAYLYIIDLNKKVDALASENEGLKTSLQSISTSGK